MTPEPLSPARSEATQFLLRSHTDERQRGSSPCLGSLGRSPPCWLCTSCRAREPAASERGIHSQSVGIHFERRASERYEPVFESLRSMKQVERVASVRNLTLRRDVIAFHSKTAPLFWPRRSRAAPSARCSWDGARSRLHRRSPSNERRCGACSVTPSWMPRFRPPRSSSPTLRCRARAAAPLRPAGRGEHGTRRPSATPSITSWTGGRSCNRPSSPPC